MRSGLFKRITAAILSLSMIIPLSAHAYSPGPTTYEFDFSNVTAEQNVTVSKSGISLSAGGSVTFEIALPFSAASVDFKYSAKADTTLDIKIDDNAYSKDLSVKETDAKLELLNDRAGVHEFSISSTQEISIKEITFNKVDVEHSPANTTPLTLTTFEEAVYTTVAIHENAVALFDKGAMRYLDFDDARVVPRYFNGSLHIPAFALARAMDMYLEDYADMEYLLLRSDDDAFELYAEKGTAFIRDNANKKDIASPVVYDSGITWLPVRQIAELLGKTVLYKDGMVVIDDKLHAGAAINDSYIFGTLKGSFDKYIIEDNSQGKVYHVSKESGSNDRNPGTADSPFKTIGRAAELAEPGDRIIIHEGHYSEIIRPKNDGTPSRPIVFEAAEGENVEISTFKEISGFLPYDGNVYCAEIPKAIGKYRMQVFMGDEYLREGRHPNTHNQPNAVEYFDSIDDKLFATHGDIFVRQDMDGAAAKVASGTFKAVSDTGLLDQEDNYWKGATFTSLKGQGWELSSAIVKASSKGEVSLDDGGNAYSSIVYFNRAYPEDWGYLANHMNTLDMPGEWYYDGKTLYIIPPEGVKGEEMSLLVKQGFTTFDLSDKKCIQVKNINTRGGGMSMAGDTENIVINGGEHKYISHATYMANGGAEVGYEATAEVVEDDINKGAFGMMIEGTNNAFINSTIYGSGMKAITVSGTYNFIYNNEISNIGYTKGAAAVTLRMSSSEKLGGHQVVGNSVHAVGTHAINSEVGTLPGAENGQAVGACLPVEVSYNHIYDSTQYGRDSGVLYMHYGHYGTDREYSKVHHNLVHDSAKTHPVGGTSINSIYFDNSTSGIDCYSNILYYKREEHDNTAIYIQRKAIFPTSFSTIPNWNNKALGHIEKDVDMKDQTQIPTGKPFLAGPDFLDERFMENYNLAKTDYSMLFADYGELSDGAVMTEDGFVDFNDTGKITYKDVDLTGKNMLSIYAAGEKKLASYVVKVDLFKDGELQESVAMPLQIMAEGADTLNEASSVLQMMDGKFDIVISPYYSESEKNVNLLFAGVRADVTDKDPITPINSTVVFGGAFTNHVKHTMSQKGPFTNYDLSRFGDYSHNYASWIFENTLIYENVTIPRDYTDVQLYAMRWAPSPGYKMQIRIGSETAKPIAEIDLDYEAPVLGGKASEGWYYVKDNHKLNETLKAGTYDIYVTFDDTTSDKETGRSCDLEYFAFFNEADQ